MSSRTPRLVLAALLLPACSSDVNDGDVNPAVTRRVSVAASGAEANRACRNPDVTPDGRYVVFESAAGNLVPGDVNGRIDVFRKDLRTGEILLVSVNTAGEQGDGDSTNPSISDDGSRVAFASQATNLAATDGSSEEDVYVRKIPEGETVHVSQAAAGGPPFSIDAYASGHPHLSTDGGFVAFASTGMDLDPDVFNDGSVQIFLHDLSAGTTRLVSLSTSGSSGAGASDRPSVSAFGAFVAFHSEASDLVDDDGNLFNDVFVRDMSSGETERVSEAHAGGDPDGGSLKARVTPDGRHVVFESTASNLVPDDLNGQSDVFIVDRTAGTCERVSRSPSGGLASKASTEADVSPDGRFVVFLSEAPNLVPGDANGVQDVFWHDRASRTTYRVSVRTGGAEGSLGSEGRPASTSDGRFVVFASEAPELAVDDANGVDDIFLRGPLY